MALQIKRGPSLSDLALSLTYLRDLGSREDPTSFSDLSPVLSPCRHPVTFWMIDEDGYEREIAGVIDGLSNDDFTKEGDILWGFRLRIIEIDGINVSTMPNGDDLQIDGDAYNARTRMGKATICYGYSKKVMAMAEIAKVVWELRPEIEAARKSSAIAREEANRMVDRMFEELDPAFVYRPLLREKKTGSTGK